MFYAFHRWMYEIGFCNLLYLNLTFFSLILLWFCLIWVTPSLPIILYIWKLAVKTCAKLLTVWFSSWKSYFIFSCLLHWAYLLKCSATSGFKDLIPYNSKYCIMYRRLKKPVMRLDNAWNPISVLIWGELWLLRQVSFFSLFNFWFEPLRVWIFLKEAEAQGCSQKCMKTAGSKSENRISAWNQIQELY